jgi:hypothetical protein
MAMAVKQNLPVIDNQSAAGGRLTRREMVQRLLAGAGAGAAWPLVATAHPIHRLLSNDAILAEAEKLGGADWNPTFLNTQQNATLIALAESIVPGSTRAKVNQFVDLLLSVDVRENQRKFIESLAAFDTEAKKRFANGFSILDGEQKNTLLTDASAEAENSKPSQAHDARKQTTLHRHFQNLKGWVSGAYYSSEIGMRELGWTGDYAFEAFPTCQHPEGYH